MIYDLLLKNADIITLDPNNKKAEWVAIKDGKIEAVGGSKSILPTAYIEWDLKGMTILPGFCDSHVHGTLTGDALCAVDLGNVSSIDDILDLLKAEYDKKPQKDFIIGTNYLAEKLKEKRDICAKDLDRVIPDKKVLIYNQSYHGCILNSNSLAVSGLDASMTGVEAENKQLTGVVNDDTPYYIAISNLMSQLSDEQLNEYMNACSDKAISKGITTIHALNGSDYQVDMPGWINFSDRVPIHIVNYWETMDVNLVKSYRQKQIGGCICLDGTRILRTMALFEPYRDFPSTRGILYYKDDDIYNFVSQAHENDMQCAMHAAGERAIDQYIYILDKVIKEKGTKDLRHRIEHFSMPTKKHINMAVELQLALPMQPVFSDIWDKGADSIYKQRFGKERAAKVEPIREIIEAGGMICGGSDSPVTPMDPLAGINACVNNPDPNRNISVSEALKIFTLNGAWSAREDKIRGTIEVGKYADLVILDQSPYRSDNIKEINIVSTIINGITVYKNDNTGITF